ncbi:hypothetical protein [Synechococcus sp. UW179A]|uniref:hypothetical protein n=1 Tax=Synechococcus sp. UW179A TaxID=2575510 RepID=UPI001483CA29|nr:hypothetical protein [Synechococcus sp. UW179A]
MGRQSAAQASDVWTPPLGELTAMVWSDYSRTANEQQLRPQECHLVFNLAVIMML